MNSNPFRDAALAAAQRGWFVFPLEPGRKVPATLRIRGHDGTVRTWPQYATTDIDRVRRWWSRHHRYNIAVATGPSNLHVIDIDSHTNDLDVDTNLYPPTFTITTPRGRHLYYAAPITPRLRNTVGLLADDVDTRGDGGYVVTAGSATPHGEYRIVQDLPVADLPTWLIDAFAPAPPPLPTTTPALPEAYIAAIVTDEAARVAAAQHHSRNGTLFRAAFNLGRLVAAGALQESRARTALATAAAHHIGRHGFTRTELDRTLTNGLAYGARHPRPLNLARPPDQQP
ncbi:DNA primase [Nocardia panacis]|uniref:DNA primase n=1 Tax=Nocardia panacis TaxID=2340916 RepID=A0A3A4KQ70_9NOCA|nr:bifunctional DNA primase/polymerase [Nocardia panacis]RJO77705.1 DNA primase [Nocardia panacis]